MIGRTVLKSSLIVAAGTLFSSLLRFAVRMLLAGYFGAGPATDAYLAALSVSDFLATPLVWILGVTFVPVFIELRATRREEEAWLIARTVIGLTLALLSGASLLLFLLASPIARLLVPGFRGQTLVLTVRMLQLFSSTVAFSGLAGLLTGVHQSFRRFTLPSFAPALRSLAVIGAILLLAYYLGIMGAAWGMVLGTALQAIILLVGITGPLLGRLQVDLRHPAVLKVGRLMLPMLVGSFLFKFSDLLNNFFASGLAAGSITHLNYAYLLVVLLATVIGGSLTEAFFPDMAEYAARGEREKLRQGTAKLVRLVSMVVVPLTVLICVLSVPLIRLLYERGAFGPEATRATAVALAVYSFGLLAQILVLIFSRAHYALQDTLRPQLIAVALVAFNVMGNLILIGPLGHVGIALANCLAFWGGAGLMLFSLVHRLGKFEHGPSYLNIGLSAGAMGLIAYQTNRLLEGVLNIPPSLALAVRIGGVSVAGAFVFGAMMLALGDGEMKALLSLGRRAFRTG